MPEPETPEPKYVEVKVCIDSGMLAGNYCPISQIEKRKFLAGEEPTEVCNIHKKPEPKIKRLKDNPKPDWMPRMICAILGIHTKKFDSKEIEDVIFMIAQYGVDYLRIFLPGWGGEGRLLPFKKDSESGKFDLNRPNQEYDLAIKELRDICHKHHIKLYGDLFDQCQYTKIWHAFKNNINDIRNIYDYRPHAMEFWKHEWIDRWLKVLDVSKGDRIGLGNELRFPNEKNSTIFNEWAEKWGVGLTKHLLERGVKKPIYFSGSKETAHKLHGFISGEVHPELDTRHFYILSCWQIHGVGLPEHLDIEFPPDEHGKRFSIKRYYAYSDDGVGCCGWNKIPEDKRGLCPPSGTCCSANTKWRIETVKYFLSTFKNPLKQVHSIEFLPREVVGDEHITNFNVKVSAYIYSALAKKLWDIDIKRPIV